MNGRTKAETLAAWRRVLTADLGDTVTARDIAAVVGIAPRSARQWLTDHLGPPAATTDLGNVSAGLWTTSTVRDAVKDMSGPGNRTNRRGKRSKSDRAEQHEQHTETGENQ